MSQRTPIADIPGLAEKVEAARLADRRRQRRYLAAIVAGVLLAGGALVYVVSEMGRSTPAKVVIDPAKLPPIQRDAAR